MELMTPRGAGLRSALEMCCDGSDPEGRAGTAPEQPYFPFRSSVWALDRISGPARSTPTRAGESSSLAADCTESRRTPGKCCHSSERNFQLSSFVTREI